MQNCIFNTELVKIHNCISKEKLQIHFITDYIELEKCCNCISKKKLQVHIYTNDIEL